MQHPIVQCSRRRSVEMLSTAAAAAALSPTDLNSGDSDKGLDSTPARHDIATGVTRHSFGSRGANLARNHGFHTHNLATRWGQKKRKRRERKKLSHADDPLLQYIAQFISWWTVTAYVYNTVYSEITACNPTLTRWLQHRYKRSRLCVTEQWPRQTHV